MRVDNLQQECHGDWITVSARMVWEDSDRSEQIIRFQVGRALADEVECNPNAFLAATSVPAMYYGERRVRVEGALCPVRHDTALTVLTQLREWYDKARVLPVIEASQGFAARKPRTPRRAGMFFSGGVDALATLRRNRLMYPDDHPLSIRDCLNVFGMHPDDYSGSEPNPNRVALWDDNLPRLRALADEAGVELFQLRTNVVSLFDSPRLFGWEYHSAIMLSLGHLLTRRLSDLFIASSDYLGDSEPWGSHPLIDPNYGGSNLQIYHDGARLRRIEKVRLITEWPAALSSLNVCSSYTVPTQGMNCGKCEKCVRTMLELLACGALDRTSTFPAIDVDPKLLKNIVLRGRNNAMYFVECLEPLRAMGRLDLVNAIGERLAEYEAWQRKKAGRGLRQKLKKLDERYFAGRFSRKWQSLRKSVTQPATV